MEAEENSQAAIFLRRLGSAISICPLLLKGSQVRAHCRGDRYVGVAEMSLRTLGLAVVDGAPPAHWGRAPA